MIDFYGWMYEIDEDTYHGSWGNIRRITQWVNDLEINARNRNNTQMFVKTIEKTTKLNLYLMIDIEF